MANFYGSGRSNYVKVKDKAHFETLCEEFGLTFIEDKGGVGFYSNNEDGGFNSYFEDEKGEEYERNPLKEFSECLKKDEVLVYMCVGSEKMRYLSGFATAINSDGDEIDMNIDRIYNEAKTLGKNITLAEY